MRGRARAAAWRLALGGGAVAAAAVGTLGGAAAARLLRDGFAFDWFVQGPTPSLAPAAFAVAAGRVVAGAALAGAVLALVLQYALVRKLPDAARRAPRRRWTRGGHALLLLATLPIAAGLLAAELLWLAGGPPWTSASYEPVLSLSGGVAALAAFSCAWWITSRAFARDRIAAPHDGDPLVGRLMLLAARHARVVLALVLALSLVAAAGAARIRTDVDVVDVLPRGDANTDAAHNLTERFKSSFTLQVTIHVRVNPDAHADEEARHLPYRATEPAPENITDEVYVRAIDEMVRFVKAYVPQGQGEAPFRSSIGLASFYQLINWTIAGGRDAPDASYAVPSAGSPEGSSRYAMVHEGVWRLIPEAPQALLSPDFQQAAILFLVDPHAPFSSEEIGRAAMEARDAYVAWAETDPDAYKVFTGENAPRFTVDIPLANAHQTDLALRDFQLLLPIIALFIAVCLYLQFRDARALAIAFTSLSLAVLWTFGVMGYLDLPLNTVNVTVVPLMMGVGIDYAIHILNEHQHSRAAGLQNDEAFRRIGGRSGLALFVATVTSIVGLVVMVVSPSLLIAQLGFLCCVALASMYVMTVAFIPAAVTVLAPRRAPRFYPSHGMRAAARAIGRQRAFVAFVVLLVSLAAYASSRGVEREPFGDPPRNWLEDDPLRREHEEAGREFYASPEPDAKANVLVFQGDVMDPRAHAYMDALEAALKEQPRVLDHTLRTLPFILRTYLTVREGIPGGAQYTLLNELSRQEGFRESDPYPDTREEIRALAEEAAKTPLREFGKLFYAWPDQTIAVMTFTARAATFEEAVEVWDQVWAAVGSVEAQRPEGMEVSFVGNTATNYLFVQKQVPWMEAMVPVVAVAVVLLVLLATRDAKAALVVGVHNVLTGVVWLGMLPLLGIGLSITLTLPLVFIFALGSDYALHLSLACRDDDSARVFETTGKAVLFSAVTTLGAFAIFTQVSNLAVQRAMLATAAAIVALFVVTTLVIPLFYPPKKEDAPAEAPAPPEDPAAS